MIQRLEPGRFYGNTLRQRSVCDLVLADVLYPASRCLPRHTQERAYFCLIRQGAYTEHFSHCSRECGPSMLVFHPPGERHSQAFRDRDVASFNVQLGPQWLARMQECGAPLDQPMEFAGGRAVELGYRLFQEAWHRGPEAVLAIESLTAEILGTLAESRPVGFPGCGWLRHAREALEAGFDQPHSLGSLARAVGVHPVYLASQFRRAYGCSAGEFVRRLRLDFARQQLAQRDAPLAGIACAAGFADQSHFTRTFKRFTGMTPSEYRTFLGFKTD